MNIIQHIHIEDNNVTAVMDLSGDFICTHDGSDHLETLTENAGQDNERDVQVYICDGCGAQMLLDGSYEV